MVKYISLGTYCLASTVLKHFNLKTESYPFDWIVSTIPSICDIIDSNFTHFLNKKYIEEDSENDRVYTKNKYYQNEDGSKNITYFHHNLLTEKDYQYFERCVQRWKDVVYTSEKKYLILTTTYLDMTTPDLLNQSLINANIKNYTIVIATPLYHENETIDPIIEKINNNIYIVKLYSSESWDANLPICKGWKKLFKFLNDQK